MSEHYDKAKDSFAATTSAAGECPNLPASREATDDDLKQVVGGINPQPLPPERDQRGQLCVERRHEHLGRGYL